MENASDWLELNSTFTLGQVIQLTVLGERMYVHTVDFIVTDVDLFCYDTGCESWDCSESIFCIKFTGKHSVRKPDRLNS